MFKNKADKALIRERDLAREQSTLMSDHLANHQSQIEIMAEVIEKKDKQILDFISRIHETIGGDMTPTTEDETLAILREQRAHADLYRNIREVLAGRYDADASLLRNLACALGCSQFDSDSVIRRGSSLAVSNRQMKSDLANAAKRIVELSGDDDGIDWDVNEAV